ncbi:MAG: biotin--[acetyl-CoA-carboxylase] ligase [Rhodospirillaceae bacterium]
MAQGSEPVYEALLDGWRLVALSEVDSTNEEVRRRAAVDPAEGLAVMAAVQTAGRGRRGRTWVSPPGNLYLSVRLNQGRTLAETAQLSFVVAVALADALAEAAPHVAVRFKWPNDLLIGGAKVSGILLETDRAAVIVGIGVNVAWAPDATTATYPATSLKGEGADLDPRDLARGILRHLKSCVEQWRARGFAVFRAAWLERAQGLGQGVVARLQSGEEVHGIFVDLDADGALVVDGADAGRRRILAGDVFFAAS